MGCTTGIDEASNFHSISPSLAEREYTELLLLPIYIAAEVAAGAVINSAFPATGVEVSGPSSIGVACHLKPAGSGGVGTGSCHSDNCVHIRRSGYAHGNALLSTSNERTFPFDTT